MRVIEGTNVDLISPFPTIELDRAVQWFFQYSSYTGDDSSPKTPETIKDTLVEVIGSHMSYGVIDKNNITQYEHEAPLVGIISFAPQSRWNGYVHFASNRSAWSRKNNIKLADEGTQLAIDDLWAEFPDLMRMSALVTGKNYPARRLLERCGFKIDGVLQDFFQISGKPIDAIHLGILKTTKESSDNELLV